MKSKIIVTDDNSKTLLIPELNETYHSTKGALTEAQHVFIKEGLLFSNQKALNIFEMGFGTGLNAILTLKESFNTSANINYHSVESHPLEQSILEKVSYIKDLGINEMAAYYQQMHSAVSGEKQILTTNFHFLKWISKIEYLALNEGFYDIIFYDAFGPKVQPELWDTPILQKMHKSLKTGGFLVTYCAQGQFKRNLKSIGFDVKSLPGPPGKREMTRAFK